MIWEIFKKAFLGRLFPRKKRKSNVEESINLHQVGMSVLYYSLKFTIFPKYDPSLVSDLRDEISRLVTGEDDLKEEYCSAMLDDNMKIYFLM